jgi:D-arabinose 1-dehydrogenase-like Zn-dependent alcohol dehydrogenase
VVIAKQCVVGDEVLCANAQFAGMMRDGGYQEFMIARADYVLPLPDALGFTDAALIHAGTESIDDSLLSWDGGADIMLQVAPSAESASAALKGLASDGTFVLLAPVPVCPDPMSLIMRRQRIMGSPAGSRKELRAVLDLAAAHRIRPQLRSFPLDRASEALTDLETARPAGRVVLVMKE